MDLLRSAGQAFTRARERVVQWFALPHRRLLVGTVGVFALAMLVYVLYPHAVLAEVTGGSTTPGIVDKIMLWVASMFLAVAQFIGKIISLLIDILVSVILYNRFSTSQVVSAGWAIVRDAVNMFYVILLIAIAFGTIIGYERFKWREQVPRVLRWAIIINFSKTLCGLAIDASQVFTLTFANALKDIAGGNIISFLGLASFFTFTVPADSAKTFPTGFGAADYFGASIGAVVMMTIVLGVLVALLVIMVFRIVMLWVLIVISPLTWFVGSAKGIIDSKAYSQWWSNFKCFLVIGPVLTFFLWLALAVAGAGNVAASEGFTPAEVSPGLLNQIFEPARMTSFIIGLAILWAGFQTANDFCSAAAGGIVQKALGKAQGFAKSTALAPLQFGGFAAKGIGSRIPLVGSQGLGMTRNQLGSKLARGVQGGLRNVPLVGGAAAGLLNKPAEHFEHEQHALEEARAKRAEGAGKSFASEKQQMAFMKEASDKAKQGKQLLTSGNREAVLGNLKKAVDDKDFRKKLEDQGMDVGAMMQSYDHDLEEKFGHADPKFAAAYKDFKGKNAGLYAKKGADGQKDWGSAIKDGKALRNVDIASMKDEDKASLAAFLKSDKFKSGEFDSATGKELSGWQMVEQKKLKGVTSDTFTSGSQESLADVLKNNFKADTGEFENNEQEQRLVAALKKDLGGTLALLAPEVMGARGGDNAAMRAVTAAVSSKQKGGPDPVAQLFANNRRGGAAGDPIAKESIQKLAGALSLAPENKATSEKLRSIAQRMQADNIEMPAGGPSVQELLERSAASSGRGRTRGTAPAPAAVAAAPAPAAAAPNPDQAAIDAANAQFAQAEADVAQATAQANAMLQESVNLESELNAARELNQQTSGRDRREAATMIRDTQARIAALNDRYTATMDTVAQRQAKLDEMRRANGVGGTPSGGTTA